MLSFYLLATLTIVNTVSWYGFLYYLLYSIKYDVKLPIAAFILLILLSLGIITCPFIVSAVTMHFDGAAMMMTMGL